MCHGCLIPRSLRCLRNVRDSSCRLLDFEPVAFQLKVPKLEMVQEEGGDKAAKALAGLCTSWQEARQLALSQLADWVVATLPLLLRTGLEVRAILLTLRFLARDLYPNWTQS